MRDTYLILNQFNQTNVPLLFSWPLGGTSESKQLTLSFDNFNVDGSCSVSYQNEIYILGGRHNARAVAKVDGCKVVKLQQQLPDNYHGHRSVTCENIFFIEY